MPTIFTHSAVPLAMSLALGCQVIPKRLMAAGVLVSILPDLDVLSFRLGIPYAAEFGHRGFSHSLFFAFGVAVIGSAFARHLQSSHLQTFLFLFVAAASHGVLDTFTSGGLGIGLLWPFSDERFFAPYRPIAVSPFGFSQLISKRGLTVAWSEIRWVWLPLFSLASIVLVYLRSRAKTLQSTAPPASGKSLN